MPTSPALRSAKRARRLYHVLAWSFAFGAWVCQNLYFKWHWDLFFHRPVWERAWLSWPLIDGMHMAAMLLALGSLCFSVAALRKGPVWAGVLALLFALLTCAFSSLIT